MKSEVIEKLKEARSEIISATQELYNNNYIKVFKILVPLWDLVNDSIVELERNEI